MRTADVTMPPRPQGFTLIELMVALAIAALLLMLGVPSFTTFLRNSEIRSTTESIVNGLRAARTEATRRNERVKFTLAGGGDASWQIDSIKPDPLTCELDDSPDAQNPIQKYSSGEGGANVKYEPIPKTAVSVVFNGLGQAVTSGPCAAEVPIGWLKISSTVSGDWHNLQINVTTDDTDALATIRVCDPALNSPPTPDPRGCHP